MTPAISIIIPVCDEDQHLRKCLDSIANQTMHDLEILCVNYSSSGNKLGIVSEFAASDSRFLELTSETHCVGAARNTGLSASRGRYTLILSPSDWLEPAACDVLYKKAESSGADLIQFLYGSLNPKDAPSELILLKECETSEEKLEMRNVPLRAEIYLYRTEFLSSRNIRFPEDAPFSDPPFVYSARFQANKIVICPQRLYTFRNGILPQKPAEVLALPQLWTQVIGYLRLAGADNAILNPLFLRKLKETYKIWETNPSLRSKLVQKIRLYLAPEEINWIVRPGFLPQRTRYFFLSLTATGIKRLKLAFKHRKLLIKDSFIRWAFRHSSLNDEHNELRSEMIEVIQDRFARIRERDTSGEESV